MVECRDWLKTLWAASYKGAAFFFEADEEEGGRDQIVHQFPNVDTPFLEDMGEAARYFSGTAYVHGDDVDGQDSTLKATFTSIGPGPLVVPLGGPVLVRLQTFKRRHERDKLGYIAYELKFVREGAATALISVASLLNAAFGAADTMAASIVATFPKTLTSYGEPDHVITAATDTMAAAAATLDVLRVTYAVDPASSPVVRDAVANMVMEAPTMIAPESRPGDAAIAIAQTLVSTTRVLADAMSPDTAARAMLEFAAAFEPVQTQANLTTTAVRAAANAAAVSSVVRLAALTAYAEAMMRKTYAARPDGVAARAEIAERFDNELSNTPGAVYADLFRAIDDLSGRVVEYLSQVINDLAPLINIEIAKKLPAVYLAFRLYADPLRDAELIARNQVRNPAFMPQTFVALAR